MTQAIGGLIVRMWRVIRQERISIYITFVRQMEAESIALYVDNRRYGIKLTRTHTCIHLMRYSKPGITCTQLHARLV